MLIAVNSKTNPVSIWPGTSRPFSQVQACQSLMTLNDCSDTSSTTLTAREICQVLREVVLGRRTMTKVGIQT